MVSVRRLSERENDSAKCSAFFICFYRLLPHINDKREMYISENVIGRRCFCPKDIQFSGTVPNIVNSFQDFLRKDNYMVVVLSSNTNFAQPLYYGHSVTEDRYRSYVELVL